MGQYAHGNQPVQHVIYLYNYDVESWKTQQWVREAMNKLYKAMPDGYCGDEADMNFLGIPKKLIGSGNNHKPFGEPKFES